MRNLFKISTLLFALVAFVATAVLCCCVIKDVLIVKKTCSQCDAKSHSGKATSSGCCFSKASPMEVSKTTITFVWTWLLCAVLAFLYIRPHHPMVLRSLYASGPPGHTRLIPIYIKSRSLRL